MIYKRLLFFIFLALFAVDSYATSCAAIFPGNITFAANGSSSINGSSTCNSGACSPVPNFTAATLPSISPSSSFTTTSISDGVYESTTWGLPKETTITFTGTGTAVLYFSGSATIPKDTWINVGGDPSSVIIVVYGSLTINKDARINAHIYAAGSISINKDSEMGGAVSAGGALTVDKDSTFTFDPNDVAELDGHGFCTSGVAVDHYEIEHDGSGSICSIETVTIKACANSDCSSLYTGSTSVDFLVDGNVQSSPTFTGSTSVNFSSTSQGGNILSLANASISADNADTCDNTSGGTSCSISFDTSGCLDCNAIFPGSLPFAKSGSVSYDLKENVVCNGGSDCSLESMSATASPVIPSGGSNQGSFNIATLSDQAYNYYTSWSSSRTNVTVSSGTAVLYFDGNGNDIIIPENSQINASGNASQLLIVVTDGKLIVKKNSTINAYIYADTSETKFEEDTTFNGGVSVISGTYIVEKDSNYDFSTPNANFNPHGFCAALGPKLELHLNFDEGSGQTVADDSGNGRTGALGSGIGVDNQDPTFTCEASAYYMDFDRSNNEHVITPSFTPPADGVVAFWLKVPNLPSSRQRIFGFGDGYEIRWESNDIMYLDINKTGSNSSIRTSSAITSAQVVDNWLHVAVVSSATNNTWAVYLNGVLDNSGSETLTAQSASVLTIGGSTWRSTSEHLDGAIDDFRIYSSILTASEIAALAATPPADCAPSVHHYEITHDGHGLTCAAESVVIKACTNSDCSTLSSVATSLELRGNGGIKVSPTFTGSDTVNFDHTTAGTLALTVTNPSITPTNSLECVNGSSNSCNMLFASAGFRFLYGDSNSEDIANQVSGNIFTEDLKLQAVEDSDGVCTGIFNGNVDVNLSQENAAPTNSGAGRKFQVNNVDIAKFSDDTTSVTLNFGSDSIATIPNPRYLDAGEILLHASYSDSDISLEGTSRYFWVSPDQLVITHTAANPQKAGVAFDFNVTAYNSVGTGTDNTTLNYQPGQMQLLVQRTAPVAPVVSVDGTFTYKIAAAISSNTASNFVEDVNLNTFSDGVSESAVAKFSEVGEYTFDVQDRNFGSQGIVVSANSQNLRFTPSYFVQTINSNGSIVANHSNAVGCSITNWVYTGEETSGLGSIRYGTEPVLTITAYNDEGTAQANITQNYTDSFATITPPRITLSGPTTIHTNSLPLTGEVSAAGSIDDKTGGVIEYTFSDQHHFTYTRNVASKVAAYDAEFEVAIDSITDADGVLLKPSIGGTDYFANINFTSGVNVRFGRLSIENNFGPETESLPMIMHTQYWDGSSYVNNIDDSCSSVQLGSKQAGAKYDALSLWDYRLIDLDNTDTLSVNETSASIPTPLNEEFELGNYSDFIFSAPSAGNVGGVEVEYSVPAWLKSDWKTENDYTDNPSAILSFGLFRGNDRIIYWREVGN